MFVTTDPSRRRVRHQYYPRALIDWVCHRLRLMMTSCVCACVCVCVCVSGSSKQRQTNWRNHEVAGRVSFVLQRQMGILGVMRPHLLIYPLPSPHTHTHTQPWAHYICVLIHFVWIFRYSGFPSATAMGRTDRASHPGIILLCLLDNRLGLLNKIHYFIKN